MQPMFLYSILLMKLLSLSEVVSNLYNTTISSLLDKHAPLKTKTIRAKKTNTSPHFQPRHIPPNFT